MHIITSGPVSASALQRLSTDLHIAQKSADTPLPSDKLFWTALDAGLDRATITHWQKTLGASGLAFVATASDPNLPSVEGMCQARENAWQHIQQLPDDAIVCWLDSDLQMQSLCPDAEGELFLHQPFSWLNRVWDYALTHPDVQIAIGDVTGDLPVPASSTLLSNLRDLRAFEDNSVTSTDPTRWRIKDAAYDISDLPDHQGDKLIFPLLNPAGEFRPLEHGVLNALLWTGTVARPLTYDLSVPCEATLHKPHRPWYIRGGVTIIFKKESAANPVPRIQWQGEPIRRQDSLWMLKSYTARTASHFPYPLFHRRGAFSGNPDELVHSFVSRGVADMLGAATVKTLGSDCPDAGPVLCRELDSAIGNRIRRIERTLNQAVHLLDEWPGHLDHLVKSSDRDIVVEACTALMDKLTALPSADAAETLTLQVDNYLLDNGGIHAKHLD